MDIRKPKPVHSFKALLTEIGVIVLGILIALGLEQGVQWLHWRSEVTEANEAIRAEMNNNLWALEETRKGDACAGQRMALLRRWADGEVQLDSAHLAGFKNRQIRWLLWDTIWDATKSGGTASHLPLDNQLKYAGVYGWVATARSFRSSESTAWAAFARYQGKGRLTPEEASRLKEDVGALEAASAIRRDGDKRLFLALKAVGATPVKPSQVTLSVDPQALCRPPA